MQQLLAWCGRKALSEPRARSRDPHANAKAAARVVEEAILADLTEKKVNVSWWDESEKTEEKEIPKMPNPKNENHLQKIVALEQQLKELEDEKRRWQELAEQVPQKLPKKTQEGPLKPENLDRSLLRTEEAAVIPAFEESSKSITTIQSVMTKTRGTLEFKVDQFSHGMHKAKEYGVHAKSVSESLLAKASILLDKRQEALRKAAGTSELPLHEILRSISHLDRA